MKLFFIISVLFAVLTPAEFSHIIKDFAKNLEALDGHNILAFNVHVKDDIHLITFKQLKAKYPDLKPFPANHLSLVNLENGALAHFAASDVINHDINKFHPEGFEFYRSLLQDSPSNQQIVSPILALTAAGSVAAGGLGGATLNEKLRNK